MIWFECKKCGKRHGKPDTQSLYESLPNAQLAVIPGASHIAPYEKPGLVFELVTEFLRTGGEVNTMMPIRRRLA